MTMQDDPEEQPMSEQQRLERLRWTEGDIEFLPAPWDLAVIADTVGDIVRLVQDLEDLTLWFSQQEDYVTLDLDDAVAKFMEDPRAEFMPEYLRKEIEEELGL